MSLRNLIVIGVVLIGGYWYYQNMYLPGQGTPLEQQLQHNAKVMDKCVKQETTMAAASGMAGISMSLEDATEYCASENNLYQEDGQWHRYQ